MIKEGNNKLKKELKEEITKARIKAGKEKTNE